MYIAGLDIHDILRRSPLTHNQGVEGIVWLTTLAAVVRAARRHAKGAHHPNTRRALSMDMGKTGIPSPTGENIGHKPAPPLLVKILSPVAHGVIIVTPLMYLVGTAWGRLEQPEWFSNWALPDIGALSFGQLAALRTAACAINYGALYLWKRASHEIRRAVRVLPLRFLSPIFPLQSCALSACTHVDKSPLPLRFSTNPHWH